MIDAQAHVFISYSRANKDFVDRLAADLQARGLPVWIDKQGLKPGTPNWEQALRDAISASRAVLLIATPDSRKSPYVGDELGIAAMYKRPVYPVWAGGQEWLDSIRMGLGSVQFIDARETRYAAALDEIVTALSGYSAQPQETAPGAEPTFEPRNPYKGLNAFTGEDRGDFFGRDALVVELRDAVEALTVPRFLVLAVVGPSGSGKSSVVMAGLLPQLQDAHADWVFLPPMVPGVHPLERLSIALADRLGGSLSDLRKDLDDPSTRGLHLLANRLARKAGQRVVLLVDQFEELFTLTADERQRQQFIDLLTTAVAEPEGALLALITLRADFWDRPLRYAELGKLISEHNTPVLPLSLSDLRDVIEKPAALPDVQMRFDDGLVAELVFDVRGQPGALPLLQFTLEQLFERRDGHRLTQVAYHEMGGVKGALAKHAEATYDALPTDEHRRLTRALFLRLIEPGATEQEIARRRASLSELTLPAAQQTVQMRGAADAFVKARLLTTGETGGVTTIEVSHEALIREWERLGNWLKNARDDVRLQKQISQDASEWARRGKKSHDDGLYRGTVLEDAQSWAKRSVPSADEVAFLAASISRQNELLALEDRRKRELIEASERAEKSQQRSRRAQRITGLVTVVAATIIVLSAALSLAASANSRAILAQATLALAQIEVTAAGAQAAFAQANVQVKAANATLTPIPVTLTAVAQMIDQGNRQIESLRLAAAANGVLQDNGGNVEIAALLGIRALKSAYTAQADAALVQALDRVYTLRTFAGHTGGVNSVAFSPNGKHILTGSRDSTARLWDAETGQTLRTFAGHTGGVNSVAFSPDGKRILTGSSDNTARLWDAETGQTLRTFTGHTDVVTSVAFSPDGKRILTSSSDATARLWDAETGQTLRTFTGNTDLQPITAARFMIGSMNSVSFSPDGERVLTGSLDGAHLWDAETGQILRTFAGPAVAVGVDSVAFSPDGKQILTSSLDGVELWDAETGQTLRTFDGPTVGVTSVAFSPDGKRILTGSIDNTARLWDAESGQTLRTFIGHTDSVQSVAFSPDGKQILTGSGAQLSDAFGTGDFTARLWDAETGQTQGTFIGHKDQAAWFPDYVAFSSDGRRILTSSLDGVELWDAETGRTLRTFHGPTGGATSVAFSPDGRRILTSGDSGEGSAELWDTETGQPLRTFTGSTAVMTSVAFSPDGKRILTGSNDTTAQLWDADTGQPLRTFNDKGEVLSVAFSPDGKQILTGNASNRTARLWDAETGQTLRTFAGHTGVVSSVALSPDGKRILTGSWDNTARLWDAETGQTLRTFAGHTGGVTSVVFSPDGKRILTGSRDTTARLWDAETGQPLRIFAGHTAAAGHPAEVTGVTFSPDGRRILTASDDHTARLWDTDYRDFVAYACKRLVRDFTDDERRQYSFADHQPTCPQFATAAIGNRNGTPVLNDPLTTPMPPTTTSIPDLTLPVWTPIASPTLSPSLTPTETSTPTATPTYPGVLLTFTASPTETPLSGDSQPATN